MILRIFLILLAVNTLAFVARADASEATDTDNEIRMMTEAGFYDNVHEPDEDIFELADLGARFLKWRFTRYNEDEHRRFASKRVSSDHGFAVVEDGAALNLKWRF